MKYPSPSSNRELGAARILEALGPQFATFLTGNPSTRLIQVGTRDLQIGPLTPDLGLHLEDPELGSLIAIVVVQFKPDPKLPGWLAALTCGLAYERGCPVVPVVVHTTKPLKARSSALIHEIGEARFEVSPLEIILPEFDARAIVESGMDGPWWPFMSFMRHGNDRAVMACPDGVHEESQAATRR